jgi:uncharacterized protein
MTSLRRAALVALAVLAAAGRAFAEDPLPPAPRAYLNDYANVIPDAAEPAIEEKLRLFDEQTSSQIVVALFPKLPSASMEDFTIRTAQSWGVGRKKLSNGVVLFVFVEDRDLRTEVGYGLEGVLPDATANRIQDEVITPRFRAGDYAGGISAGVDAIMAATRGEYKAPPRAATRRGDESGEWLTLLIILVVLALVFRGGGGGGSRTFNRRGGYGGYYGGWVNQGWGGGGGGFGGGGFGGGGGGGFSGGGGSFGGGGASGSW